MSEHQNVEIIRSAYEAFGRGDMGALLSLFDKDIEWVTPGPQDLPTAGHRHGRQAVAEFFKALTDTFEIQRFEPKEFIAQGNSVVVVGEETARIRSTGAIVTFKWAHLFKLKDGTIMSLHEYGDTTAAVAGLRVAHTATL